MIKFCKMLLGMLTTIVCIAAISGSTLILKSRYDRAVEAATQARMAELGFNPGLKLPAPGPLDELPGREKVRPGGGDVAAAQAIIDEELRDATPEEREIWADELKQRSPQEIREILALRNRFVPTASPKSDEVFEFTSGESLPPQILPETSVAEATRIPADSLALIASSIEAVQTAEQVIFNNIANANTIGFKRSRVLFGEASGLALGSGAAISTTQVDVSQGRMRHTRQTLDLAIQGDGFFQINEGQKIVYTRAGSFSMDANSQMVLASRDRNRLLEPTLAIPQDVQSISISHDGTVAVLQAGQSHLNQIGAIRLVRFLNPAGLIARGENLFEQSSASGAPIESAPGQDGLGEIRQEYLEESNVSIDDELAELRRLRDQLKALRQLHAESIGPR